MSAPIDKIAKKLIKNEMLEDSNQWKPKSIRNLLPVEPREIIHRYNTVVNGLMNYYSFVDNRPRLKKIVWVIKESLRKTLARKYKLNKAQFKHRFGEEITTVKEVNGKQIKTKFLTPDYTRRPMHFLGHKKIQDPFKTIIGKNSIKDKFTMPCAICGTEGRTEMHHLKHIRTINLKLSKFDQMIAKQNRKQVPLCNTCHDLVHSGQYAGQALRYKLK